MRPGIDPRPWRRVDLGDPADGIPEDAPLHTLLLAASRLMGAFFAGTLVQAGLRIWEL